jgi:hypothetical protein
MSPYIIRFSKGLMTGFLLFLNFLFLYSVRRQDNGIYNSFRVYYLLTAPPEALENIKLFNTVFFTNGYDSNTVALG